VSAVKQDLPQKVIVLCLEMYPNEAEDMRDSGKKQQ
jgi:hypothetical protein